MNLERGKNVQFLSALVTMRRLEYCTYKKLQIYYTLTRCFFIAFAMEVIFSYFIMYSDVV